MAIVDEDCSEKIVEEELVVEVGLVVVVEDSVVVVVVGRWRASDGNVWSFRGSFVMVFLVYCSLVLSISESCYGFLTSWFSLLGVG